MRNKYLYILFLLAGIFTSCAEDVNTNGTDSSNIGITTSVKEKIAEDLTPSSRSSLTYQYENSKASMKFQWDENDWITVIPQETDNTIVQYKFDKFMKDNASARFLATNFELKQGERYFSFSMKEDNQKVVIPSKANITVDYSGQVQIGNASIEPLVTEPVADGENVAEACKHLGAYDFMASCGVCKEANQASLDYQHLGSTYRIRISGLPLNVKYGAMEIFDSQNSIKQPKRTLNLLNGFNADTESYVPALDEPDVTTKEYINAERFKLTFKTKNSDGTLSDGIMPLQGNNVGQDNDEKGVITGYIELPPLDFTAKSMIVRLIPTDPAHADFYASSSLINRKLGSGYVYRLNAKSQQATQYPVTIKVNHAWQQGQAITRGTGDPGIEEKFPKPTYLYCIFCVNEKVVASNLGINQTAAAVNKLVTSEGDWDTSADKIIDTYKTTLTFTPGITNPTSMRAYIVASNTDLMQDEGPNIFSSIAEGDNESEVKALTYSIANNTASDPETKLKYNAEGSFGLETYQSFMRDLYSTAWGGETSSTIFAGDIKNPYQDIILYHVAAKVDLKWNTATALPTTDSYVQVNNVKSQGLSLFIPTKNTGSGNYTVTSPIDPGTMYNGREYFYLPQFNTYNVKIGDKAAEDATFTPYIKDGFTSWLRWLKQY